MSEKECFGVLHRVFPMGERGLREVAPDCQACPERVPCLKAALRTREGLEMRSEILGRSSPRGFMGGLKRWSRKKALSRLAEREKERRR